MDTEQKVFDIISEQLSVDRDEVMPAAQLVGDFHADNFDITSLVMALEEEFDIEIPDDVAEKIVTVQDAVDCVEVLV